MSNMIRLKRPADPLKPEIDAIRPSKQRRWKITPSTGEDGETSVRPAVAARGHEDALSHIIVRLEALAVEAAGLVRS